MATRLERGLKIFLLLQKGVPYDAIQLAQKMGVSRRTIFRDMALLKEIGLPVAYDPRTACYSYDADRVGQQFKVQADEMHNFLVSVTVAAGRGESLDQDDLRSQVASFASRLPKPMREEVEASLQMGNRCGATNSHKMRLVVAKIAQAIGYGTTIQLMPVCVSKMKDPCRPEAIIVVPHELKCTSKGWTLTATVADAQQSNKATTRDCRREFPLRDYTVASLDD